MAQAVQGQAIRLSFGKREREREYVPNELIKRTKINGCVGERHTYLLAMGMVQKCKVCKEVVDNDNHGILTGYLSVKVEKKYQTGRIAEKNREDPR